MNSTDRAPVSTRRWVRVCSLDELEPGRGTAAIVDGEQVALFRLPGSGGEPTAHLRAIDNRDPTSGANVMARGIIGSSGDVDYVVSPMHKHRFDLLTGACLDGESPGVRVWPVRVWGRSVEVLAIRHRGEHPRAGDAGEHSPGTVQTHCPYCALQCAMGVRGAQSDGAGIPAQIEIVAQPSFPVNQGRMCVKGWTSVELLRHPDRLLQPLVRDDSGRLHKASWEAALDELASRLVALRSEHGPASVGVFGSGALTNEKAYLIGKFARVALRTPHIDYNGRYCMASAAAAQNRAFGLDRGLPFPLSDVAEARTLVLWGANPADTMPPLVAWLERQRAQGGQLVVVDPRHSATAQLADLHLQPRPGTDLAVALGLLHLAVETGAVDARYIEARTIGWHEARDRVAEWAPSRVERVAGVPERLLRKAVEALATATPSMVITGRGPEQQVKGTDTVSALINLMLALGQVGRHGGGYGCLTGQANGQGGREHGQKADQLPGYRSISDEEDRAAVAAVWGVEAVDLPGPGVSAVEMLERTGPGGIRGMIVAGSNVAVASPDTNSALQALDRLDLLAVLDSFLNETTQFAHIVLPVSQWAEEDGTTTNLEGRVLRRRKALPPPEGVLTDIEVLCALASRLGHAGQFSFAGPEDVFEELRVASAGGRADYSGISYERLEHSQGIFWPCPDISHPGAPRLFTERFAHPDGRAHFMPISYRPSFEQPDPDYPVFLTTGRYREHYNSGNQTRRINRLREARPEPRLAIHPELASKIGVPDGGCVVVESRRGQARFRASVDVGIRPDTVFAPFHWPDEGSVNLLTVAALDPVSRMPELKLCAVRVRAADE